MENRQSVRASWHDYNEGTFFVTICTHDKRCLFGQIQDEKMNHSPIGLLVEQCIISITGHLPDTVILNHVVMPNHIHLIVSIMPPVGAQDLAPAANEHVETVTDPVGAQNFAPAANGHVESVTDPVGAQDLAPAANGHVESVTDPVGAQNFAPAANGHVESVTDPVGAQDLAPAANGCLKGPKHGERCDDNHFNSRLAVAVRSLKAAVTRLYNKSLKNVNSAPQIWQRGFHEHIIRNKRSFDQIWVYIDNNVSSWTQDCFNK